MRPQMRIGINSGLVVVTQIRGANAPDGGVGRHGKSGFSIADTGRTGNRQFERSDDIASFVAWSRRPSSALMRSRVKPNLRRFIGLMRSFKAPRGSKWRSGAASAPYVGRDRELAVLRRGLGDAREELRVIDITAEPGMGKSRLLYEFRQRIGQEQAFILTGSCSPDGRQTPFLPFIEVVRSAFQVKSREAENDVVAKAEDGADSTRAEFPREPWPVAQYVRP